LLTTKALLAIIDDGDFGFLTATIYKSTLIEDEAIAKYMLHMGK